VTEKTNYQKRPYFAPFRSHYKPFEQSEVRCTSGYGVRGRTMVRTALAAAGLKDGDGLILFGGNSS